MGWSRTSVNPSCEVRYFMLLNSDSGPEVGLPVPNPAREPDFRPRRKIAKHSVVFGRASEQQKRRRVRNGKFHAPLALESVTVNGKGRTLPSYPMLCDN